MSNLMLNEQAIQSKIYTIREMQVMIDSDIAELYGVETRVLNQAVKRNSERFPNDLMFELDDKEFESLKSQIVTSSWGGRRYNPKVFTEQGIYMLATVLKSKIAVEVTLNIMRTFTKMKYFISQNRSLFEKIEQLEKRQIVYEIKTDQKIDKIFKALKNKHDKPAQGIFFDGQIWDAYEFVNTLLKNTKKEVILIDNYIDDTLLTLCSKYPKLNFIIVTKNISKQLKLDLQKYNSQYNNIKIITSNIFHDRFLLIDDKEVYHIGASLKDLGKKVFGFSKMDIELILGKIKTLLEKK